MNGVKLTDRNITALTCPDGRKDVLFFDSDLRGFCLRVTRMGYKGFIYQYRISSTVRRQTIGDWPTVTAAQARRRAELLRGRVKGGADPVAERKAATLARFEQEREAHRRAAEAAFTVGALLDAWDRRALKARREGYRRTAIGQLRLSLAGWMETAARSYERSDVARLLDEIAQGRGPMAANRTLSYARACYGWAVGVGLLTTNPFQGSAPTRPRAGARAIFVPRRAT